MTSTKTITLRSGSGTPKGSAALVEMIAPAKSKATHNGDGRYTYLAGWDLAGLGYETKSRGGGWRRAPRLDRTTPAI